MNCRDDLVVSTSDFEALPGMTTLACSDMAEYSFGPRSVSPARDVSHESQAFCNFGPSPVLTLEHQDINSRTSSGFDEIERPVQGCHHELENADEEKGRLLEDGASEGRYRRCLRQGWTLEIISEAVALAGLLAMVGLLRVFEGRPITTWPYEKFTLNGAIALLATVIKTGLVIPVSASIGQRKWIRWSSRSKADTNKRINDFETYDEASRGPFGCGRLLFVTPRSVLSFDDCRSNTDCSTFAGI